MKYCTACGNDVRWDIPDNDNRERHICNHCGQIHYQNPRITRCGGLGCGNQGRLHVDAQSGNAMGL